VHQPVSRGLAVFADAWLSDWLAEISADLRETVVHRGIRGGSMMMRYTNPRLYFTFFLAISALFNLFSASHGLHVLLYVLFSTIMCVCAEY